MRVTVTDAGTPRKSADATVRIDVLRNLHKPVFERSQYVVNINETHPYRTTVLMLNATDGDNKDQPGVGDTCVNLLT